MTDRIVMIMPKRPFDTAHQFLALPPLWQIAVPALARVATIVMFDLLAVAVLALTGAKLQKSLWVSGFYFPAGLIVFFAFVGSPWAVAGVALGTFVYTMMFRMLPWPMDLIIALPSAAALFVTMILYWVLVTEKRLTPLSLHVSFGQIATISAIYAFWNFVFNYLVFVLFVDELQTQLILNFHDMALMLCGDFLGSVIVLSLAKAWFVRTSRERVDMETVNPSDV